MGATPTVSARVTASPVTRAIRVIGDRWALLVVRDAFQGVRRFDEFVARTGASRSTLTRRLGALVAAGILVRKQYLASPRRFEYRLTERGRDLFPLALVCWDWERRWAPEGSGIPLRLRHDCGRALRLETACGHCGERVEARDVDYVQQPGVNARAVPRLTRGRRLSGLTSATHQGSHDTLTHIADIVGDPWTPLVLAAAFFGVRRYDGFQRELGIATNILASRLELLVAQRVFARVRYQGQPPRHEYVLTDKGRALFPYAVCLHAWGGRWLAGSRGVAFKFMHRTCGRELEPVVRCTGCGATVLPGSLTPR
jgi:DNA-binding HxlR family transcriptional regulator